MAKDLKRLIRDTREARAEFEARLDDVDVAKERYYETVRRLYEEGMPLREIADTIGVSHQRVHQIVGAQAHGKSKRAHVRRARAGGVALVIVALVGFWIANSVEAQPRQEAIAALQPARDLLARRLSDEARHFILPQLDHMLTKAHR